MSYVYVSGPVIRGDQITHDFPVPGWVGGVYEGVFNSAQYLNVDIAYPQSELQLERADPRTFYKLISERIANSQAAIVVFTGPDVSTGIEASMAASLSKPILLVSDRPDGVPRLLAGLPQVLGVIRPEVAMGGVIMEFMRNSMRGNYKQEYDQ